jgi:hypothetical protein
MSESSFRLVLVVLAASQLGLAVWMIVSPGSFFDAIAGFGAENDHYIRDVAVLYLAVGAGLAVAVTRRPWRFPVLAIAATWYLAHAVNHLVDIGESDPDWVGPVDFVAILVTGLLLLGLAVYAARTDVEASASRPGPPS